MGRISTNKASLKSISVNQVTYYLPLVETQNFKKAELKIPKDRPEDKKLNKKGELKKVPDWYIYYSIWDYVNAKWEPQKFYTDFLNNSEALALTPKERIRRGTLMVSECNQQLEKGINPRTKKSIAPFEERTLVELFEDLEDTSNVPRLREAIEIFLQVKSDKVGKSAPAENKENTATTYKHFFNQFQRWCDENSIGNKKLDKYTKQEVFSFMQSYLTSETWGATTYNSNLGFIKSFFNYFAKIHDFTHYIGNIEDVEVTEETERFEPFTPDDVKRIFKFLGNTHEVTYPRYIRTMPSNPFLLLVARTIFYSFMRPSEIRRLKIKHVKRYASGFFDLTKDITKNKKAAARYKELHIDPCLVEEYRKLNWEEYFSKEYENYYVFTPDLIPSVKPAANYQFGAAFARALDRMDVIAKESGEQGTIFADAKYSLYSLKHTGNIVAYKSGYTIAQLQLQNRHSSEEQTENYLRELKQEINLQARPIRELF